MGHYVSMRSHVVDPAALRRLCRDRGMTLRKLQTTSGLSYSFIKYVATPDRHRATGAQRNCSDTSVALIAAALGVGVDRFTICESSNMGHGNAA